MNYVELKSRIPGFAEYAYLDHKDHLADGLFIKHKVRVHFRKGEYVHPDYPDYCIIGCLVRKKNKQKVEDALHEMENKMLVMGNIDYPAHCERFKQMLESWR